MSSGTSRSDWSALVHVSPVHWPGRVHSPAASEQWTRIVAIHSLCDGENRSTIQLRQISSRARGTINLQDSSVLCYLPAVYCSPVVDFSIPYLSLFAAVDCSSRSVLHIDWWSIDNVGQNRISLLEERIAQWRCILGTDSSTYTFTQLHSMFQGANITVVFLQRFPVTVLQLGDFAFFDVAENAEFIQLILSIRKVSRGCLIHELGLHGIDQINSRQRIEVLNSGGRWGTQWAIGILVMHVRSTLRTERQLLFIGGVVFVEGGILGMRVLSMILELLNERSGWRETIREQNVRDDYRRRLIEERAVVAWKQLAWRIAAADSDDFDGVT